MIKKYISSYDAWRGNSSERYEKGFPIIRYAEILLSYAEALNQLTTTHAITLPTGESYSLSRDMNEIAKAFNQVRYRAGLPGLTQAQLESPTEMFEHRDRVVHRKLLFLPLSKSELRKVKLLDQNPGYNN